ncbi:AraC family transcriptional regulator [Anaerosacchariphilus polymeriproducens]|nr:AraC family transcriptional regulator [Anaerosacchariphilus polymeriproducens]
MIQCFTKKEFTPFFSSKNPPSLISVSKVDSDYSRYSRMLHKHNDRFELLFVRSGTGGYRIEQDCYHIKTGDIVLCNTGVLHDEVLEMNQNLSSFSMAIKGLQLSNLPENFLVPPSSPPVFNSGEFSPMIDSTFATLYQLLSSGIPDVEETCHNLMMSILSLVMQIINQISSISPAGSKENQTLGIRIKEYIDEHYDESLSLDIISQIFHVNSYYLSHVFKKEIGLSPMQYVSRRRIGEAQSLLITTQKSITDISSIVGFGTPNHFHNQFTKYVGLSPRRFRKTYTLIDN